MAFGSPVGGFITDFFGWRYCFKINIIPFLLLLYVYMVHMKNYKVPSMNRIPNGTLMQRLKYIDFGGSILSCMGNTSLCAILILGGNTHDWSDPLVLSLMALAIMSYISLAVYECYVPRNPLVPPHLLGNRTVVLGCIGLWLLCSVVGGTNISMPQYYIVSSSTPPSNAHETGLLISSLYVGRTRVLYKQDRLMYHGVHIRKRLWILFCGTGIYTTIYKG